MNEFGSEFNYAPRMELSRTRRRRQIVPPEMQQQLDRRRSLEEAEMRSTLECLREESRDQDWISSFIESRELDAYSRLTLPKETPIFGLLDEQEGPVNSFIYKKVTRLPEASTEQPEAVEPLDLQVDVWDSPLTRDAKRRTIHLDVVEEPEESLEPPKLVLDHRESAAVECQWP